MKIIEALANKSRDNFGNRSPVIAFLGDSVTQGCFEIYRDGELLRTVFDSDNGYVEKTKQILRMMFPETSVSVINAGINGGSAKNGLERLQRDVLCHDPDLVVVCFGLNDCNDDSVEAADYKAALKAIFAQVHAAGKEVIFMTPNRMNAYVGHTVTDDYAKHLGELFATRQNNGYFDAFIEAAREACAEEQVPVCDCYRYWCSMDAQGVDTTALLSNGLNHPTRDMHSLFAWELVRTMFQN